MFELTILIQCDSLDEERGHDNQGGWKPVLVLSSFKKSCS